MKFSKGINLGGHFEDEITTEELQYPIQDWYVGLLHELGFDHVRLPIKWTYHCDDDNGYAIHPRFGKMVHRAVDELLDAGFSVIINIHHFREAMDDPRPQLAKLTALWEQIATEYADYPDSLVFEVLNEPTWRTTTEDWQYVQDELIKVIRRTNPTREIMICGIDYSGLFKLPEIVPPEGDPNIIGTFHYYFPFEFTHQGAEWTQTPKPEKPLEWLGTEEEVQWCKDAMRVAYDWSQKYGLPVNVGEFGAYKTCDADSRCRWTRCVRDTALEYGFSYSYWELNRGFGICEPNEPKLRQPLADALVK